MSNNRTCVSCTSGVRLAGRAVISPWIRKIGGVSQRISRLWICPNCDSGGFDYRYSDDEMAKLYAEYRHEPYFAIRNAWEPTYTPALNIGIGSNPEAIAERQHVIRTHLEAVEGTENRRIKTVLDVGGDRGQFMPKEIATRLVLDVSTSQPVDGVHRLNTTIEARAWAPEAVLLCGILEHVASPRSLLREIFRELGEPSGLVCYVEVPSGVPTRRAGLLAMVGFVVTLLASLTRPSWNLTDRYLAGRRRKKKVDRLKILRQSEHLNFFSNRGLRLLLEQCGMRVLDQSTYEMPSVLSSSGRLEFSHVLCATAVWPTNEEPIQ